MFHPPNATKSELDIQNMDGSVHTRSLDAFPAEVNRTGRSYSAVPQARSVKLPSKSGEHETMILQNFQHHIQASISMQHTAVSGPSMNQLHLAGNWIETGYSDYPSPTSPAQHLIRPMSVPPPHSIHLSTPILQTRINAPPADLSPPPFPASSHAFYPHQNTSPSPPYPWAGESKSVIIPTHPSINGAKTMGPIMKHQPPMSVSLPLSPSQIKSSPITPSTPKNPTVQPVSRPFHLLDVTIDILSDNNKRKWRIIKTLGKGGCGEVYLAEEIMTGAVKKPITTQPVALKVIKDKKAFFAELNTMRLLNKQISGRGRTPKLICTIRRQNIIIMEYLSDSLAKKFEYCKFKFSLKTVCMLTLRMMTLAKDFYEKTGQVHVDLKPSNFCMGPYGNELYLIDFGYSIFPDTMLPGPTGTAVFMPQRMQTVGRVYPEWADDLESIGYIIMYFIAGGKKNLPWGNKSTHKEIAAVKSDEMIGLFCRNLIGGPFEPIASFLHHFLMVTRDRSAPMTKDKYHHLFNMLCTVMTDYGLEDDAIFDWCSEPDIVSQGSSSSASTYMHKRNLYVAKKLASTSSLQLESPLSLQQYPPPI